MKQLLALLVIVFAIQAHALEPGEITEYNSVKGTIHFYTGDVKLNVGEILGVKDSNGRLDLKFRVTNVDGQYADAEFAGYQYGIAGAIEPLSTNRRVRLIVDASKVGSASFLVGPNFAPKEGEFGGTGYSLGLSFVGPILGEWLGSLHMQADDLGKDSLGNGKRISYYMVGGGRAYRGLIALAHIGMVDYMTMPVGGKTIVDPYTGANYPDNVQHTSKFGYLLVVRYPFTIKTPDRNSDWGWSISPMLTFGGGFSAGNYKPIPAAMVSFDFQRVF